MSSPTNSRTTGFIVPETQFNLELEKGDHFDEGKLRLDLISPVFEAQLAKALTFGANKYGDYNWQAGIHYLSILGSLKRHINNFERRIDIDDESGLHHLAHAASNLMFLVHYTQNPRKYKKNDNRRQV